MDLGCKRELFKNHLKSITNRASQSHLSPNSVLQAHVVSLDIAGSTMQLKHHCVEHLTSIESCFR
jgi:hypothetical protein